jgi:hypothetical protein
MNKSAVEYLLDLGFRIAATSGDEREGCSCYSLSL